MNKKIKIPSKFDYYKDCYDEIAKCLPEQEHLVNLYSEQSVEANYKLKQSQLVLKKLKGALETFKKLLDEMENTNAKG